MIMREIEDKKELVDWLREEGLTYMGRRITFYRDVSLVLLALELYDKGLRYGDLVEK